MEPAALTRLAGAVLELVRPGTSLPLEGRGRGGAGGGQPCTASNGPMVVTGRRMGSSSARPARDLALVEMVSRYVLERSSASLGWKRRVWSSAHSKRPSTAGSKEKASSVASGSMGWSK